MSNPKAVEDDRTAPLLFVNDNPELSTSIITDLVIVSVAVLEKIAGAVIVGFVASTTAPDPVEEAMAMFGDVPPEEERGAEAVTAPTVPEPAFVYASPVPVEVRTCPAEPTVLRPVPPEDIGNGLLSVNKSVTVKFATLAFSTETFPIFVFPRTVTSPLMRASCSTVRFVAVISKELVMDLPIPSNVLVSLDIV